MEANNNTNFYKEATDFLNSQLPSDFDEKIEEFAREKGYYNNSFKLWKFQMMEALGLKLNFAFLKMHIGQEDTPIQK